MDIRYHIDPDTDQPHIYGHGVTEEEVRQILVKPGQHDRGTRNTRMKLGQTDAGRYLLVVYATDEGGGSVFVITARELHGKALKAFRRRRRKGQ